MTETAMDDLLIQDINWSAVKIIGHNFHSLSHTHTQAVRGTGTTI